MAVFKCKMCGGTLDINDETVAVCEYCGTQQTVPTKCDENLSGLFNRANTLRMKSEFDKAEQIYERIVQADNTQAEAYWGLILCKYGIEYVEDPKTFKRIPTCHRTSFDSIIADEDYKSALNFADSVQRGVYEAEAKEIDRIQKGILALSKKEEPYDVFICYKETDDTGRRTTDSVIANDIYHQLTQEGLKVFYAAITLEDKLGQEYEPYIFAALNSAKVMLVIGTRQEYFSAVWVKNEWGRFLKLMSKDRSKMLIPCYKDIDAYELPEEFAHLQAQDMSKIGFINDVVRGIKKVTVKEEKKEVVHEATTVVKEASSNVTALIKRGFMALEDREWDKADGFFEQALNFDAENAESYLGKLMAELKVSTKNYLAYVSTPFDDKNNYKKAIRFGDDTLKAELEGICKKIRERNEENRKEQIYFTAKNHMKSENYDFAIENLKKIIDYNDSKVLVEKCEELKEEKRKDNIYQRACLDIAGAVKVRVIENAIKELESIIDYKDAKSKIAEAKKKIDELNKALEEANKKREAEKAEHERQVKEKERAVAKKKKLMKKLTIVLSSVTAVIVAVVIVMNMVVIPSVNYNKAKSFMEEGNYDEAIAMFEKLGKEDDINEVHYRRAMGFMEEGRYDEAYDIFIELGDYRDAADKANLRLTMIKEKFKGIKDGSYIEFGTYEQDNDTSNGKEEVEWFVLEVKDGKAMVVSKYALDCKQYNTSKTDVTWETCTLRTWLNNDFINDAFSTAERAMIPAVLVSPDYSSEGNATQDQIFLLSINEVNKYFSSYSARQCKPTDYAVANGAGKYGDGSGYCRWWVRAPGAGKSMARSVKRDGDFTTVNCDRVNSDYISVRPAMWIDISTIE